MFCSCAPPPPVFCCHFALHHVGGRLFCCWITGLTINATGIIEEQWVAIDQQASKADVKPQVQGVKDQLQNFNNISSFSSNLTQGMILNPPPTPGTSGHGVLLPELCRGSCALRFSIANVTWWLSPIHTARHVA